MPENQRKIDEMKENTSFYKSYMKRKNSFLSGKAWMMNEKIGVKDAPDVVPKIHIDENREDIVVIKNGERVKDPYFELTEKDHLQIEIKPSIIPPKCDVTTDRHQLTAFIEVEPGYKIVPKIKNFSPTHEAVLKVEEYKMIDQKIGMVEVKKKLNKAGIVYGINEAALREVTQSNTHQIIEVATGSLAKEGKDGYLEAKVDSAVKKVLHKDEKGNIDFRENQQIPTVEVGEILAIIHPPIEGEVGRSVTNELIYPKPVTAITFQPGQGIGLEENHIIASKIGRPFIHQKNQVVKASIIPKFIQKENVAIATGNIHFYGDVEVFGAVEENMVIDAGNDLVLHSSVNSSTITATHSIVCKGHISNSVFSAGERNELLTRLSQLNSELLKQLEQIYTALEQITQSYAYKQSSVRQSQRSLLNKLVQKRFQPFLNQIKEYTQIVAQNKTFLSQEWIDGATKIQELFIQQAHLEISVDQLKELAQLLTDAQATTFSNSTEPTSISADSAVNSTLKCNGNIDIMGHGCLNTRIVSKGQVKIAGCIRGGKVFAQEGMIIKEAGSIGAIKTILAVPEEKSIQIEKAYEGTELKIGSVRLVLNTVHQKVLAHLSDGMIKLN